MSTASIPVRTSSAKASLDKDMAASKSVDAFRTISEVSEDLDVPQHVLRFWEGKFAQIKPLKRGGGRRYYRPDDVDLLRGIRRLLHVDGYTIKGVQKVLRDQGAKMVVDLGRGTILRLDNSDAARTGVDDVTQLNAPVQQVAADPAALGSEIDAHAVTGVGGLTQRGRARLQGALAALDQARTSLQKIAQGDYRSTAPDPAATGKRG